MQFHIAGFIFSLLNPQDLKAPPQDMDRIRSLIEKSLSDQALEALEMGAPLPRHVPLKQAKHEVVTLEFEVREATWEESLRLLDAKRHQNPESETQNH